MASITEWLRKLVEGVVSKVLVGLLVSLLPPLTLRCHVQDEIEEAPPPDRTGLASVEAIQQVLLVGEPWVQVPRGAFEDRAYADSLPDVAAAPPALEGYGGPPAARSAREEEEVVDAIQGERRLRPGYEWVKR